MNDKSIDGLKRRNSSTGKATGGAVKPLVKSRRQRIAVQEDNAEIDEQADAIRDFLSSVADDNPTSLASDFSEQPEERKKKRRKKDKKQKGKNKKAQPKGRRVLKIVLRVLGVLLIIAIGAGVWLYIQGNDLVARVTGGNLLSMLVSDPDVPLETDPNSGRTNILIFGTEGYSMDSSNHPGYQLTDSMMVASLDQDSGDVRIISLPRDWKTKTCTSTSKLNETYYCTYSGNKKTDESRAEYEKLAARALADKAEEILGVKVQYTVHLNWQAVVQIVDAVGGIDVAFVYQGTNWTGEETAIETTSKSGLRDYYNARTRTWLLDYKNGEVVHLNGEKALGVARSRNASGGYGSGSNYAREQFQQKIIQAIILKARKTNFVADFMAALNIKNAVGDNLRMNFKDTELKTLFKLVTKIDIGGMKSIPIEKTDTGVTLISSAGCGGTLSYQCPVAGVGNTKAIHDYVARKLSSDPVMSENAKIAVLNATSVSGVAASEGKKLEGEGFNVAQSANAPAALGPVEGVKIYQKNNSVTGTAKALGKFYNVEVLTTVPDALTDFNVDFVIVLGNGYSAIE